MEAARSVLGQRVAFVEHAYDALPDAVALLLLTEWKQYRSPDFTRMSKLMARPLVLDGRNLFEPRRMRERGFEYACIGRPAVGSARPD
jgi:UDPglucose 6-dehydrogenase